MPFVKTLVVVLAALLALAAPASAEVPDGATWTQDYIPTPDGEELHVDLLRPEGLDEDDKTPVIAIISPYLGHAAGGIPSDRFKDFFDGARVFERGYSVAMVDLRGSGGSSGCLDILGPGEQTDIATAVEWAATRPWSTGRVGMYGKSYDGNTGVAGAALQPKGLEAVVAQQVVGDRYSGSYSGGIRYLQSVAYPFVSYGTQAEGGWTEEDDERYAINSFSRSADCQAGLAGHYNPDPQTDFWRVRDFVAKGKGSTVPFLMTHGFLDTNTNIGAKAIDFFNGLAGPKRLWLGWWDHVRGNDMADDRLAMGRPGWFDEVMRFYDEHLKGISPRERDPAVVLQDSEGGWRSEASWPPADAEALRAPLRTGSFDDDGRNLGSRDLGAGPGGAALYGGDPYVTGAGVWTLSPPLPYDAHMAGIPQVRLAGESASPQGNAVVNVYDVAPDGAATMISRGAHMVGRSFDLSFPLYPTEWRLRPGHRIGVLVSGANAEAWVHVPGGSVTLTGGEIELPFLRRPRSNDLSGDPAPRLESYKEDAPFPVDPEVLAQPAEPALVPPEQAEPTGAPAPEPQLPAPEPASSAPPVAITAPSVQRSRLRAAVRFRRTSLRRALRRGLRGTASCSARCTLTVTLRLRGRALARRTFTLSGTRAVRIRFSRASARRLRRASAPRLAILARARAGGEVATSRTRLLLRR